jgi:hypothetical protein
VLQQIEKWQRESGCLMIALQPHNSWANIIGYLSQGLHRVKKVGGHLAGNFSIHNSFVLFILRHNSKVGGQVRGTAEFPTSSDQSRIFNTRSAVYPKMFGVH